MPPTCRHGILHTPIADIITPCCWLGSPTLSGINNFMYFPGMLPNTSEASFPTVQGNWTGWYAYGPEYGPQYGTRVRFTLELYDTGNGHFKGTALDYEEYESPSAAQIEGHITQERIIFTKEYPEAHFIDKHGTSMTDRSAAGFNILYKGQWNDTGQQFSGTWKIVHPGSDEERMVLTGTWLMEMGNTREEEGKEQNWTKIQVQIRPEQLKTALLGNGKERVWLHPRHQRALILGVVFLLIGGLCTAMALQNAHPPFIILLAGSFALALAPLYLFIRSVREIQNWKKSIRMHIAARCEAGAFDLLWNEEVIIEQGATVSVRNKWQQFTKCEWKEEYVSLATPDSEWVYPKAAMKEEDFQELVRCAKKYTTTIVLID